MTAYDHFSWLFWFFFFKFFPLWESIISRAKCGENVGKPEINIAFSAALDDFWVIRTTEFSKRSFIYIIMPWLEHFHLLIVTPTAFVASAATQGCVLWSQSATIQGPILSLCLTLVKLVSGHFHNVLIDLDWVWPSMFVFHLRVNHIIVSKHLN